MKLSLRAENEWLRSCVENREKIIEDADAAHTELKDAVAWFLECAEFVITMRKWFIPEDYEREAKYSYRAARKAVEALL